MKEIIKRGGGNLWKVGGKIGKNNKVDTLFNREMKVLTWINLEVCTYIDNPVHWPVSSSMSLVCNHCNFFL